MQNGNSFWKSKKGGEVHSKIGREPGLKDMGSGRF